MKVNMTPNPLDVVTIHASQGDTEARQWEFELHNNGELIDTSDVTEQLVFKAYKGGTEQLLPENTSTPTTSPFKGDIRYPQGLLTDQEFLYRESPTEEDGLAKITDIKGNTLVWNQQVDISVVPSSSVINGITYDRQTSEIKATGTASADSTLFISGRNYNIYNFINGHTYYLRGCPSGGSLSTYYMSWTLLGNDNGNGRISKATSNLTGYIYARIISGVTVNNLSFKPQLFDLTSMGIDDLTTPTQVEEWLSTHIGLLPYYSYNQGTLLSFMGNGIKTVGKNLNPWTGVDYNASTSRTVFLKKGDYVLSTDNGNNFEGSTQIYFCLADSNGNNITSGGITSDYLSLNGSETFYYGGYGRNNIPFTLNFDAFVSFGFNNQRPTNFSAVQLEFGSVATDYEPYTSSTLSLPISTYFPTGMKSAGSVYDELTETKAITRIGSRAYQSGDESDTSVITDGTTTYYVLATPTETSFTTASLVTENAEIPLSNEDGVLIGKCTEQLSSNSGFFDAKIKLADEDGECYSNKIQLHIERSPQ